MKDISKDGQHRVHIRKESYMIFIIALAVLNFFGCGMEKGGSGTSSLPANDNGSINDNSSITLSWDPPSSNANGSSLRDLAGHKIYYGMSSMNYSRSVDVGHYTEAVISNLSPGEWCFSVTAYDYAGNESEYSNEMCTTI